MSQCLPVPGSFRTTLSAHHATKLDSGIPCDQNLHVTVVMKREAPPSAYDAVEAFAAAHHLTVLESHKEKHTVLLAGAVADMQKAFGVELHAYENKEGKQFHARMGPVYVSAEIHDSVLAVLGLDNRPVAKPHFRMLKHRFLPHVPGGPRPLTAAEVGKAYQFPTDVTGKGQCVALIELGGGFTHEDLTAYSKRMGLPALDVEAVAVGTGQNSPGDEADGEVLLDIEIVGSIAPEAKIAAYFAENTDQGFVGSILQAVHDADRKPSVISVSWGSAEQNYTGQAIKAMNQALQQAGEMGITVFVAAGDNGSGDSEPGDNCDFPASSPFVTGCGGTRLILANGRIASETTWNDGADEGATGGGYSSVFPVPDYQCNVAFTRGTRGVPDVAGCADPETGYEVIVNGEWQSVGGTSAVAPLYSGLVALLNQKRRKSIGFLNPVLYSHPEVCSDVTAGNNGDFTAGKAWDACSGLGSINGSALEKALG